MTRDAGFKKTGQRYTEALTDLAGLESRMFHQPVAERLRAHLQDRYGIDAVAATQVSVHRADVFRIERTDGDPWIARAFPPARPRAGAEGDATIMRFLGDTTTPPSAWRSTTPYRTSRAARFSSPSSSQGSTYRRSPTT